MTSDRITTQKDVILGVSGDRGVYAIKDMWSGLKHLYPVKTKSAEDTLEAARMFVGIRDVGIMYSDNSQEIKLSNKGLKIAPKTSQPGHPKNNAIAERTNQDILYGTRTVLEHAGLPSCFWPCAAEHYCVMENTSHAQAAARGDDMTP